MTFCILVSAFLGANPTPITQCMGAYASYKICDQAIVEHARTMVPPTNVRIRSAKCVKNG